MNGSLPLLHLGRSGVAFSRLRKQHEQLMVSTEKDVPYLCGFNEGHCFSRGFIPQSWWNIKGLPPIDIHFFFGRGGSPSINAWFVYTRVCCLAVFLCMLKTPVGLHNHQAALPQSWTHGSPSTSAWSEVEPCCSVSCCTYGLCICIHMYIYTRRWS